MNRLESGVIQPNREWCDVRELLRSAIEIERESIEGREIRLDVPENIPLALVDHTLIEQAVAKLLANAGSHTPARLPIEIDAEYKKGRSDNIGERPWSGISGPNPSNASLKNFIVVTAAKPVVSVSDYLSRAVSLKRTVAN